MNYDEWYEWAIDRFGDEDQARAAARSAAEVQQVGASLEAAERAAASAVARLALEPMPPVFARTDALPQAFQLDPIVTIAPKAAPGRVEAATKLKYLWIGGSALLACSVAALGVAVVVMARRPAVVVAQPASAAWTSAPASTPTAAPYPNMVPSMIPQVAPSTPPQSRPTTRTAPVQSSNPAPAAPPAPTGDYNRAVDWINFETENYNAYVAGWNAMADICSPGPRQYLLGCIPAVTNVSELAKRPAGAAASAPACVSVPAAQYFARLQTLQVAVVAELDVFNKYGLLSPQGNAAMVTANNDNIAVVSAYHALTPAACKH